MEDSQCSWVFYLYLAIICIFAWQKNVHFLYNFLSIIIFTRKMFLSHRQLPKYCLHFIVFLTSMLPKKFLFSRGLEEALQDMNSILEHRIISSVVNKSYNQWLSLIPIYSSVCFIIKIGEQMKQNDFKSLNIPWNISLTQFSKINLRIILPVDWIMSLRAK